MENLSLYEFMELVPDEETAVVFIEQARWRGKPVCPHCGSLSVSRCTKPQPFHCRDCRKYFSVRTGTSMAASKIPVRKWLMAAYFIYTARKGVSSIQLGKMIGVTQKTAWFLLHRLRASMETGGLLSGIIEVDEAYVGGSDRNRHGYKKYRQGPGSGKETVFGMRERGGNVRAFPVPDNSRKTLHGAIRENVEPESTVYSDEWQAYRGLEGYQHDCVSHSKKEYVRGETHTNGIESFWALLKRGHKGIYHSMSAKHLHRYVWEFAERVNTIGLTTLECLDRLVVQMQGVRLTYRRLTR